MPQTKLTIPLKQPDKTCNARILLPGGVEEYCQELSPGLSQRCLRHDPRERRRLRIEELYLQNLEEEIALGEKTAQVVKNLSALTELDECIARSKVMIEELDRRFPLSVISPNEASTLEKLRLSHAELVDRRVDLEIKLKLSLTYSSILWDKSREVFSKHIKDPELLRVLEIDFGTLLTELTKQTK